ncbi:dTDP-4-amino-4,6-dideoxygalactose transaminase [Bacteroides salyersiae]|uniref:dTDP-4-amino-4,6-dideoxygalactose transaminase n=1 Tax=Bacteroides salyersiae TaxID=291644 RepID=UPI001C38914F|nr:dTDP-4-amino-4,6-dideoxygalactose transaminase [Bacteroides salyersiae]MBV4203422.1 dTDP-4-amino-4,6-dideoxygalactose transaminase [Bacteroides salyersiae]MCB6648614.1 dTDP-4-amino-4,6-dideoxygalactose transaminase [Bacteroides salyersiae]
MIPFNKPYLTGKETQYIHEAVLLGKISGNGIFTKKCHSFFEDHYGFKKCLLTTSCTDALEMAAILCHIQPGDEVIVPSYTFVSSALAFVRQGAKIIFADSCINNPNMDANKIETLITDRTKVIIPVHYAGVSCDMNRIMSIANKYNLLVVEDAAQAIDSFYYERPLGSIGHMAAFSFHETKNVIAGEGGMLVINDERFIHRAEIIWEKGTNRAEFFRGEVNKYGWVDTGSSFLPSEIIAAFLYAQLENLDIIQKKRKELWDYYYQSLQCLIKEDIFELPNLPEYATNNAHMFYLICKDLEQRTTLIEQMKRNEILAVFHYQSLHSSEFYKNKHDGRELKNSDRFTDCLVRLPLYFELSKENIDFICNTIKSLHNTY